MESSTRTRVAQGEFAGSRWEMASREPWAPLRPYVRRLVGYDELSPHPQSQRQFPETVVVLIIEFGAPLRVTLGADVRTGARHPDGFVAGLGDSFAITEHDGSQRGVQVDLTPMGARRFFGIPLSELGERIVTLRDLPPAEYASLSEQLEASAGWVARLDLIEELLTRRMLSSRIDTAHVDWAVTQIEASGGGLEVGWLARELGYSRKHLIALFHDQVGVPPKLLAQLVRFQRVIRQARSGAPTRWAELAMAHGYCDQAHLAREVRRFTGLTPTQARLAGSELADLFG